MTAFIPTGEQQALRWLYVDFNSYFASVEQQLRPELRGKPIAVVPVATDATCAIAASYEAKAFGIKTGTPIWEARKRCPELVCVLANHERYVEFHHRIREEIDRHIPIAAVCSIDEVACQLMANESSPKRVTEIAHSIKQGLAANVGEYVRCSIGVAANRYLAKVATDLQKPDGFTILHPSDIPTRLLTLQLRDLPGIGYNMEQRLLRAGIRDMRSLWALDAGQMRKIWGSVWGEKLWHLLRGAELPEEETTRRTVGHSHVLAPELRPAEKASYVAKRLVLKAAARLRRMEYYAGAISLSIRIENGGRFEAGARCYPAQDSQTFLHLLDVLWQAVTAEASQSMRQAASALRVKKVSITLHELEPMHGVQQDLFAPLQDMEKKTRARAEKLSHALDRINQRYGRDSVLIGMLPSQGKTFSGTKIAFTRIPDVQEFLE